MGMCIVAQPPLYLGGMEFASRAFRLSLFALLLLVRPAAAPASAELVLLTTGRTLAISGHEFEGDRVVLHLPNGGQIVCARSLIVRIEADYAPPPPAERPSTPPSGQKRQAQVRIGSRVQRTGTIRP